MKQTGIFNGRVLVPYAYGCYGYTRGGGKTWHGGIDICGMDDDKIRMPSYNGKSIAGTVVTARIVTNKSNKTWEWGYYICVKLDANQTPDAVNYMYFCHCERLLVKVGQKVKSGDALAIMGNSGNAAMNNPPYKHCHLEVRATSIGRGLDPTAYAGIPNKAGTYYGNDTLDNAPTIPDDEPEVIGVQLQRLCIIGDSETIKARAKELGLPVQTVTATLIGPASAGDAMELWGMSQTEGEEYFARYTN